MKFLYKKVEDIMKNKVLRIRISSGVNNFTLEKIVDIIYNS